MHNHSNYSLYWVHFLEHDFTFRKVESFPCHQSVTLQYRMVLDWGALPWFRCIGAGNRRTSYAALEPMLPKTSISSAYFHVHHSPFLHFSEWYANFFLTLSVSKLLKVKEDEISRGMRCIQTKVFWINVICYSSILCQTLESRKRKIYLDPCCISRSTRSYFVVYGIGETVVERSLSLFKWASCH